MQFLELDGVCIVFSDDSCTAKALKALLGKGCLFKSQM